MAKKKKRTIAGDFAKAVELMLECSLASDVEMMNMGDWSGNDYLKHTFDKRAALEHLDRGGRVSDLQPDILAEAFSEFKILYRCYKDL